MFLLASQFSDLNYWNLPVRDFPGLFGSLQPTQDASDDDDGGEGVEATAEQDKPQEDEEEEADGSEVSIQSSPSVWSSQQHSALSSSGSKSMPLMSSSLSLRSSSSFISNQENGDGGPEDENSLTLSQGLL